MSENERYNAELEKAIMSFYEMRRHDSSGYPPRVWFLEGVKWQKKQDELKKRWIPVEELLPDDQEVVFVKSGDVFYPITFTYEKKVGFIAPLGHEYLDLSKITHWKRIE